MKKNILCVGGSLNQTSQLHQISQFLEDKYSIYFTQAYGDELYYKFFGESGMFDNTVLGVNSSFAKKTNEYIAAHNLKYDYRGKSKGIEYDLAILSNDLIVPSSFKNKKTVWIQEGMIDMLTPVARLIKKVGLPIVLAGNTSLNGTSNKADIYFAASKGYKDYFSKWGTDAQKIVCTGVPNLDNFANISGTDFPQSGYVLVATSDIRELGGSEDREDFLRKCIDIAQGKKIIFKLHPNEEVKRAVEEIKSIAPPESEIFTSGNIDPMIKNCDILITQFSTTVFLGLELGKKVYSYFDIKDLEAKKPIQNGGKSAEIIAEIIADFIEYEGNKTDFVANNELVRKYL